MLNPKRQQIFFQGEKESGNKGEQKKTSKDSTFLEGVLKENNTARKEEEDQDSVVTELNQGSIHFKDFLFSSIFFFFFHFKLFFGFFCMNSLNFSSYFNSINKKRS